MLRPTGSLPGDCVFASVSLTITTGSRPADIGLRERAAAEDRRSQRREIVRARHLKLRAANVRGRCRFADEREPLRHARSAEGRPVAGAHPDRLDAGQRADTAQHLVDVGVALRGRAVRILRRVVRDGNPDLREADARRIESGIDLQHAPEAAHQQARADEKHERDRNLRGDQRAAEAALAAPFAAVRGRPPSGCRRD